MNMSRIACQRFFQFSIFHMIIKVSFNNATSGLFGKIDFWSVVNNMSSKKILFLILMILTSSINGSEDYFDDDPELHSSAMNIILNRLSSRLNRVLSEFRSDLLKSSMEMVQTEASLLVKAFDLKMQNVSQMIEKEAENRQTLQNSLNSIVSFLL